MAHKKAGGSSRNGRDSAGQRRGIKIFGGQAVIPGNIIVRQCGTRIYPGVNVGMGKDYTLFALQPGKVRYEHYTRKHRVLTHVHIETNQRKECKRITALLRGRGRKASSLFSSSLLQRKLGAREVYHAIRR